MNRFMRRWLQRLLAVAALAVLMAAGGAHATDLVVERAWFEDPSGQLTWEDVQQRAMLPVAGVLSKGYSDAPIWMRLRIDPSASASHAAQKLYLRVRPMYLDEIVLFDPLQSPARSEPLGDLYPVSTQVEPAASFVFELPGGQGARDVWLRVQSSSTRLIYPEVFTLADLRKKDAVLNHLGALYVSLIIVFLLWGVMHTVMRAGPLMVSFVLYQGCWVVLGACFLGYPYLYLSEGLPSGAIDLATNLLIVLSTAMGVVFAGFVLEELGQSAWRRKSVQGVFVVFLLLLVAVLSGHARLALQINMVLVLLTPMLILILALLGKSAPASDRTREHEPLSKRAAVSFFITTHVLTLLIALPALGLLTGVELSLYVVFFYSLLASLLMLLMLQYRVWTNMKRQSEWRAEAQEAKARADEEKSHREERERLLAMLGHELKTPLATMRMLLADQQVPHQVAKELDNTVTEMAQLVDLAVQSGQVESGRISPKVQQVSLAQLIEKICQELAGCDRVQLQLSDFPSLQVSTDVQLLKVVLRNLLDNALKYSRQDAMVQVSVDPVAADGRWTLTVSSVVGRAGFPDPERVFDKYYRSPAASHRSGTGLGLYVAKGLAKLMGGELRYQSAEGWVRFVLMQPAWPHGGVGR